jgi:hypothetical protein
MSPLPEWRDVLASEVQRWSLLEFDALLEAVRGVEAYTVVRDSKVYQVEVQLLRKTDASAQVLISVDDGRSPASLVPASTTFVVDRVPKSSTRGST